MAFPEAERENAPETLRFSENDSNQRKPELFSLANDFDSPQLKLLLDRTDRNKSKPELPQLTLAYVAPAKAKGNKAETEEKEQKKEAFKLSSGLPSLNIDTESIKNKTNGLAHKALDWLGSLPAAERTHDKEKPEDSKAQEKPIAPVETTAGCWKKEGENWSLYEKQGKKLERYDSKVSDVSRDAEGNTIVKLIDGRSVQEKRDGSCLEYDGSKHLSKISYKDGSNRIFKWDGEQLIAMSSKSGSWIRQRDEQAKLKNEWALEGSKNSWQGELKADEKTGTFSSGQSSYHTDLSVEKRNSDGSKEISYPNKDLVKVDKDGMISQINSADGSERRFTWSKNPNAKGEDDKYQLDSVQVKRDGNHYHHARNEDGSWQYRTWNPQTGNWSAPEAETNKFELNNKTGEYAYSDSADGIRHAFQPGGIQKDTSRDGASLEYENGNLVRVTQGEKSREFQWSDGKLIAIHDGVQNKNWKRSTAAGWESDKGDKREADAFVSPNGEIGFKKGDRSQIIKMNGAEFERVANEKEKSQIDIRKGEVQVKAGDGSSRKFKTSDDGTEVLQESVTRDGKTESWTRGDKLPNGNYTWLNEQDASKEEERSAVNLQDGNLKIEYPDGRKYQADSSGNERLENEKQNWYINYQSGQPVEAKYADGSIRRFKFDGPGNSPQSVEVSGVDGTISKITREREGVYDYKPAKGEATKWNVKFEVSRDGTYKYTDADDKGKIVTRRPDGLMITETPADKKVVEKRNNEITKITRDGKTLELLRDDKNQVNELRDYSKNASYKRNGKGDYMASAIDPEKPFQDDGLSRKGEASIDESGLIKFTAPDGRQVMQSPGEKAELVTSKEKTIEAISKNPELSEKEKEQIKKNILDYAERKDITANDKVVFNQSLEKLAKRSDISEKEKARSYEQLNRLLENKSDQVFNAKDRALLAEQLVWHMGNPEANAQGENPNCQVTVIRGKLLYEKPSEFARMMTDVITAGRFVTKDGSKIDVPKASMRYSKGSEEATFPPQDGKRSWLGKLSDLSCANIFWQRKTVAPSGELVQAGHLVYRHDPPSSRKDTGARVYKEPGDGYIYAQNDQSGKLITTPNLYAKDIADTYQQIVGGKNDERLVLAVARQDIISGSGVALVSEDQLHQFLSENKGVQIAQIYTSTDWVWKEPARKYDIKPKDTTDGEHVVLVKDYDPVTRTVGVKNSWSSHYNHLAPDRRITLHELYLAMAKQN